MNRIAVVTGASRGLGRAIAIALAEAGADVVLLGRDADALEGSADEVMAVGRRALPLRVDVSQAAEVDDAFAHIRSNWGHPRVLVNNAGVSLEGALVDVSDDAWQRVMAINVGGTFFCLRAAGRSFLETGDGKVVNVASMAALTGAANLALYAASKAAIISLTRSLAVEWARYGVQVNAIAPGYLDTDMTRELRADKELYSRLVRRIPARRLGRPDELADLVVFLASSAAGFITGETIIADGGQHLA